MNVLHEIVARRRQEMAGVCLTNELRRAARHRPRAPHLLRAALRQPGRNIIAEFKRASPSLGPYARGANLAELVTRYDAAGASAISILTEPHWFDGSLDDLRTARRLTDRPLLRKDFVVSDVQVDEAAAAGADAVLLIAAILDDEELRRLRHHAEEELGLDAVVEVHSAAELARALASGATLIGVNNRDLRTFRTDTAVSAKLAASAPSDVLLVSESGIASPLQTARLARHGFHGFLVGESLMKSAETASLLAALRGARPLVKVCGVTSAEDARVCADLGVDLIGLNFSKQSPRGIPAEQADRITAAVRAPFVGVHVNQPVERILDAVQLHGDETPALVRELKTPFTIKAFSVDDRFDARQLDAYDCDAFLLDAFAPHARGGTGHSFDWARAEKAQKPARHLILAGGLHAENVARAIHTVRPFAVDVCSGVEISPGRKSAAKIKEFVAAVRAS